jgi:Transposase DDE domain.
MGVKRGPVGISLGSIMQYFPVGQIQQILAESGRQSIRRRLLPSDEMVYSIIAFGLFLSEGCREVLRRVVRRKRDPWLDELEDVATESAISQARTRLGSKAVARIYETLVRPIATRETLGAWYRRWRVVSIDGTTLDVADTTQNARAFGRPGVSHGNAAYPQLRVVTLLENGTHVLFGAKIVGCRTNECKAAREVLSHLPADALCLADRAFFSYLLWREAIATGAQLLWRVKNNLILVKIKKFPDGSYLTKIYPSARARKRDEDGVLVRLIEFRITTKADSEQYRLICSILDPNKAPAIQLAHLYAQRWTVETVFDELKTKLRGRAIVLRSKTPHHVRQEVYGILMAHFGVRAVIHEAALGERIAPGELSFLHAVRVIHRYLPLYVSFPPSIELIDSPEPASRNPATENPSTPSPPLATSR